MNDGPNLPATAERMKDLRLAKGWSQERLAREAAVSNMTVSRIERWGTLHTRPTTLGKLAGALDVTVAQLLGFDEVAAS